MTAQEKLKKIRDELKQTFLERADLIDGALFAFVQGTDPEVLLLLEARRDEAVASWHYGLARMTSRALRADHKEKEVWSVPNCWSQVTDRKEPYTAFFRQKLLPTAKR